MSYLQNEKNITSLLLLRLVIKILDCGCRLNQFINLCLESIFQKEIMFVPENFIRSLISTYGKHTLYNDSGT